MLTKLKLGLLAAGAVVMAVLYALLQTSEKKRVQFKAKVEKKSADIREKAHNANLKGAVDEHETMVKPVDQIKDEF